METKSTDNRKQNPQEYSSFLYNLFYLWTVPLFAKGYKRDLTEDDLYRTCQSQRSHMLGDKLEKAWNMQLKLKKHSLIKALWSVFRNEICLYVTMYFIFCFGTKLFQPVLLMRILGYYNNTASPKEAYACTFALILLTCFGSISGHTYVMGMQRLGIKLRVAICSLIYRKTLKLSKSAMSNTSTGQIVTLLSNDVRMFDYVMLEFCLLVVAPCELIAGFCLLFFLLGQTAVVGIGFILIFIPLQMYNGKLSAVYRLKIATKTDQRILLMNEIISGIQVIKMYSWEKPFAKLVELARSLEVKQIRGAAYVKAFMNSYGMFMSRTAQFLCILAYVLTGHTPVAQHIFVLTLFYNSLSKTLSVNFPDAISTFAESKVSCKRIETFLLLDEIFENGRRMYSKKSLNLEELGSKYSAVGNGITNKEVEVSLANVSAKWDSSSEEYILEEINLKVRSNEKIAIVGPVGSGKTSLLQVILKELPTSQGVLVSNGRISYAAQEPWLFKGSIRQNILFGETMMQDRYMEVLKICALEKDLKMFPHGDLSIVGEKGVMLSGGQKARINLARAVYKDADIYLLDDPLSAVDTHVGKQLFEQCVCDYLSSKCTILVTHQLQYLHSMDCIYLMENGQISASGTYQTLQNSDKEFAQFLTSTPDSSEVDSNKNMVSKDSFCKDGTGMNEEEDGPKGVKEELVKGALARGVYKRYFASGGPWYYYGPVILLFVLTQCAASSADYFITFWTNLEQTKSENLNVSKPIERSNVDLAEKTFFGRSYSYYQEIFDRNTCIYIYSSIIICIICVTLSRSIAFFQYCLSASTKLHNQMFASLVKAPMRFFNTNPSGRILNRFSKDIGAIDEFLPFLLLDTIEIGITVIAVTIILSSINRWMLIPTVVLMALFYGYKSCYIRTSRSVKRIEGIARSPVFSHIAASLQGLSTIRAFKAEEILIEEFDRHQDLHSSAYYLFLGCNRAFGMLLDFNCVIYIGIVTVSTFFTAKFGGNVGLAITQALGLTGRLQWGVRQWSETENQMTSVERILEYSQIASEEDSSKIPSANWPDKGEIEFKSVFLTYTPEDLPVLKNLTFKIESNEKIGIVGRTGAGKSSLITALFKLANIEGSIFIDGVDTKTISLQSLRSRMSIIPQEPFLFSGTLRKNLDPFDEFDDNILWSALDQVELKSQIEDSSSGLNYRVSEGGSNFSVGQRQLVCLARALIRKNKILVLDEATANVDPKTDELIQMALKSKFSDCTVLTIAHRLHTVMDSDKVLVMKSGTAVEFDHPYVLLKDVKSTFYGLVMQTGTGMAESLMKIAKENYKNGEDKS